MQSGSAKAHHPGGGHPGELLNRPLYCLAREKVLGVFGINCQRPQNFGRPRHLMAVKHLVSLVRSYFGGCRSAPEATVAHGAVRQLGWRYPVNMSVVVMFLPRWVDAMRWRFPSLVVPTMG